MDDIAGMSDDELQMLQEVLHSTRMGYSTVLAWGTLQYSRGVLYSTRMGYSAVLAWGYSTVLAWGSDPSH
jgi:hypothetical protein